MDVRLIFKPDVTPLPGHIPGIDMRHPTRPAERLIPELEIEDGDDGEPIYFVTVPMQAARQILGVDGHVWKLWAPFELKQVPCFGEHGGTSVMTVTSVDPKAGRQAKEDPKDESPKAGKAKAEPKAGKTKVDDAPVAPRIDAAEVGSELDNLLAQED